MIKVTTIGWGNGQSNLLNAFYEYGSDKLQISSIVSMSDDGRTTGDLMRVFNEQLWIHLPPPWDLRRCLFSLSDSKYRNYFKLAFEYVLLNEENIWDFTLLDLFIQVNKELLFFWKAGVLKSELEFFVYEKKWDLYHFLTHTYPEILDFQLPLKRELKWHKFGNVLMGSLYYNFNKNYNIMIQFMHTLLEVRGKIIPVTTDKAFIKAILWNGEIVESQDRISNVTSYTSWIADLELMDGSKWTIHHEEVEKVILESDYIIIGPGDLFTSIISNFIIWGVKEIISQSKAKIIYIWNSTNKWWETNGLTQLDFVNKIERFLWKKIDYFIVNNKKPILSEEQQLLFKKDISVKWWDYLLLSAWEKSVLEWLWLTVIEEDLLEKWSFYKHNKQKIVDIIQNIINI